MDKKHRLGILNKILIPDIERRVLGESFEIICFNAKNERDLPDSIAQLEAVIVSHSFTLTELAISRLKCCKAIVCASVGYDNIDIKSATQHKIKVFNVPDYGTNDVADHAFALLLNYCRRIFLYDQMLRSDFVKNWNAGAIEGYHRLTGLSIGIVGLGRIGTAFALRAKAFGLNVLFYDPYKESGYDKALQIQRVESICTLFEKCNIISLHTPLTDETYHMVNDTVLRHSCLCPIVINTARGSIVNSADICNAIYSGKIDAYLADVVEDEPPTVQNIFAKYADDPVLKNRVIITPHTGSYAEESKYDMRLKAAETILKAVSNLSYAINCVNEVRSHE